MRRERIKLAYMVISILMILYGGFYAFRTIGTEKDPTKYIIAFILGFVMLAFYITLGLISSRKQKNLNKDKQDEIEKETKKENFYDKEEIKEEPKRNYYQPKEEPKENNYYRKRSNDDDLDYGYTTFSRSFYVSQVGYGIVLEVNGNRIRDMRNYIYYHIENSYVYRDGIGVMYYIDNNSIKDMNGNYLFELNGSNINKYYFGFYASKSGNYLTLYDGSMKYEIRGEVSSKQLLLIAALLFK